MELIEALIGCPLIYGQGPIFKVVLWIEGSFAIAGTIQAKPAELVFLDEIFFGKLFQTGTGPAVEVEQRAATGISPLKPTNGQKTFPLSL